MEYKQAIIVRKDLKMPPGKMAAQVAHGSVEAALKCDRKKLDAWRKDGMKKIVLKAIDIRELKRLLMDANNAGINTALITDAGKTFLKPGTVTVLAIGPDEEGIIDSITGHLTML